MKRILALSLLLAAPGLGRAAGDPAGEVRARVDALHLAPPEAAALLAPLQHAAAAQLPERPVAAKILEGLAKSVPPARIAAAAEQVVARLGDAQAALDAAQARVADKGEAVSALALAESRLGSRDALLQLASNARGSTGEALVAAAAACAELRDAGVPQERAAQVVGSLAAHGYAPEQIAAVPRLLQQYRAEGGKDVPAFLDEVAHRGQSHGELRDVVDPFGAHGQVLNRTGPSHDAVPDKPEERGRGGRVLVEDGQRGGSSPAVDDDLAARTGRGSMGQPPNGATSGGGKGKGKGKGDPGSNGKDPGQQ